MSTYFVAPTGNDAAAGTADAPWKTLQHAADTVEAGDVVDVRAGTYAGFIMGWNGPQNGTAGAPITFQAEPGAIINARNNKTPDAINLEGSSYITVTGFTIVPDAGQDNWRTGIRGAGGGAGLVISNNTIKIRPIDQCGIMTSFTTDLLAQNNTISGGWDTGIYVANSAVRPVVRGNTISNVLGNGILLNGDASNGGNGLIPNAVVEKNIIHDVGMGGPLAKYGAGSAIDLGGVQDSVVSNNLIYNAHAKGLTLAQLQASQGSTNNLVVNNTVLVAADGQAALRLADASTGNTIVNNALYSANVNGALTGSAASLTGLVMDYNAVAANFSVDDGDSFLSLAAWQSQYKQDMHSFLIDVAQSFVSQALNDYHLSNASPLIDAGTSQRAATSDLDERARPDGKGVDIGSYEYQSVADTKPPTISSISPTANAAGVAVSAGVAVVFSEPVQLRTLRVVLRDAAQNIVPAALSYDVFSRKATLKPTTALASSASYTVTISGVRDVVGNIMARTVAWSFSTVAAPKTPATTFTLWNPSSQPKVSSYPDPNAVELGVKFSSDVAGSITGVRFYKGVGNTGTHVGHLWSSSGQLLATAVFTGETASGWQQVNFATPVTIKANTTYVASYLAPAGRYATDAKYFASGYVNGPIHVPANGGVFKYGKKGGFPANAWNASNFWVEPVLSTSRALWNPSAQPKVSSYPDPNAVELGVKFSSAVAGSITGVRFYKGAGNTGTHVGHLWSSSGQLLATAVFTGETASGWQDVSFATPVAIEANTTYVASYFAPAGRYATDAKFFASGYVSGPIRVPANGGVFMYGAKGGFPAYSWNANNYWVSPIFVDDGTPSDASAPAVPALAIRSITPSAVGATLTTSTSSSTSLAGGAIPTPAGVDLLFADNGGLNLPVTRGSLRKDKRS